MADIALPTRIRVWSESGAMCAFADCRHRLVMIDSQRDAYSLVGQVAHIVAEKQGGPRGNSPLRADQRNDFPNLILLCLPHHKLVDDNPETYSVEMLAEMKFDHESWHRAVTNPEKLAEERDDLLWSDVVEAWALNEVVQDWRSSTSPLLWHGLRVQSDVLPRMRALGSLLVTRNYPNSRPQLRRAFLNFSHVLNDLQMACSLILTTFDGGLEYVPDHKRRWLATQELYQDSLAESSWIEDMVADLVLELTRSGNWILREFRQAVDPTIMSEMGLFSVEGPMGLGSELFSPEYSNEEVTGDGLPYSGIDGFAIARSNRDAVYGEGLLQSGLQKIKPFQLLD
jgi:hypothetical protein